MKSRQRCSTIRYTVRWENHGPRTKTTRRRTSLCRQIQTSPASNRQIATPIAPQCRPRATAPSPAPRPNPRRRPAFPRGPRPTRNQWCRRAQRGGSRQNVLLCLPSPGPACRSPRTPETTERAPNSSANSGRRRDLASRRLQKTVGNARFLSSFPQQI